MKITKIRYYDGAKDKICRLGLAYLFLELQQIILDTTILILEEKQANGAAVIREALDKGFENVGEWQKQTTGGVD